MKNKLSLSLRASLLMMMLFSISYSCLATEALHTFNTPKDQARYQTLVTEVRCVVCQGQSIADSNALLAQDLREKIYRMINAHQSDAEIKDYLVTRYGEFILLQPRFNKTSALLWAFPFLGLGIILLLGLRHIKRSMLK